MRFTSGTTGDAKCVILSHRALWERTEAANKGLKLTSADRILWVLPMAYHFIVSILLYIRYGVGVIVCEDFLAENLLHRANDYNATVLYGAPLHIRLLARSTTKTGFTTLQRVISTTTGIDPEICKTFFERYAIPVIQALGIIEVGIPLINSSDAGRHPESVGKPMPSFKVDIVDDAFKSLPPGQVGRLAVCGPGMFDGYLSPSRSAASVLHDGMFVTGDLALQTTDGLVVIQGRTSSAIHVSGNKVFPDEIENILLEYPGVRQAKVFGQPHEVLGEVISAQVEWNGEAPFDAESIRHHCTKHLSAYKIPQHIVAESHIDVTHSGKVIRR
jgi:acyl-coenzyme A synthetase/AMP-(fatty) acid ligase